MLLKALSCLWLGLVGGGVVLLLAYGLKTAPREVIFLLVLVVACFLTVAAIIQVSSL